MNHSCFFFTQQHSSTTIQRGNIRIYIIIELESLYVDSRVPFNRVILESTLGSRVERGEVGKGCSFRGCVQGLDRCNFFDRKSTDSLQLNERI